MGVTIHYSGKLRDEASLDTVVRTARDFAEERGWPCKAYKSKMKTLERVIDEKPVDYTGPVMGLRIHPHEDCEPVQLEFDKDFYMQEYVKTQFAPPKVHIGIVKLLRTVSKHFEMFDVDDEGEYWQTSDRQILIEHFENVFHGIDEAVAADPSLSGPYRMDDGRIVDLMNEE